MLTKEYVYVIAVAEEGSFSKAARRLFIAQSSLSQYIINLEESLGVILFNRGQTPITPTAAGKKYLDVAYEINHMERNLQKQLEGLQTTKTGLIRIGITNYWGAMLLPKILPAFQAKYPDIEVEIIEGKTSAIIDHLKNQHINLAFCSPPEDVEFAYYRTVRIAEEEIKVAINPKAFTVFNNESTATPKLLENLPFILLREGQRMRHVAESIFNDFAIQPKIVMVTENITTAYKLAGVGFAATFIPNNIQQLTPLQEDTVHLSLQTPHFWRLNALIPVDSMEEIDYLVLLAKKVLL